MLQVELVRKGRPLTQQAAFAMPQICSMTGCKYSVPPELELDRMCVLHFTLSVEQGCAEMRRETTLGTSSRERQAEMVRLIADQGEKLARLATSGSALTDETKARILSTFLTLMNCRENIDRALTRQAATRRIAG